VLVGVGGSKKLVSAAGSRFDGFGDSDDVDAGVAAGGEDACAAGAGAGAGVGGGAATAAGAGVSGASVPFPIEFRISVLGEGANNRSSGLNGTGARLSCGTARRIVAGLWMSDGFRFSLQRRDIDGDDAIDCILSGLSSGTGVSVPFRLNIEALLRLKEDAPSKFDGATEAVADAIWASGGWAASAA
jgi:hypothetical protein